MRSIPLLDSNPPAAWLKRAAKAAAELEAEADARKRIAIIERNAPIWRDLKNWLLALSFEKCWFSEAKDCFQDWDVEHFRPKAKVSNGDGTEREGYWWLSFAWQNLRVCGRVGNAKKGTYFPLASTYIADSTHRDTIEEVPYLLDPIVKADCVLLSFNQLGEAIPAPGLDEWSVQRVELSVKRYRLDFEKLALQRTTVWETCIALVYEIQHFMQDNAKQPGAAKTALIEEKMRELAVHVNRKSVCSSAAIVCLQKSEVGWALRLSADAS